MCKHIRAGSMAERIMGRAHPESDSICHRDDALNQEEPGPPVQPCVAPDSQVSTASSQQAQRWQ